jgi:dihydrofolate synthase/folylpolyglutamate synthase
MTISFSQALDYIYSFTDYEVLPEQRYGPDAVDPTRTAKLLAALGNPHQAYSSIHIAGTKGKGSVAAICESALAAAGLRTGLYTSPHLQDFTERIQVGREIIPKDAFANLVEEVRPTVDQIPGITTFEVVTALAFLYFSRQAIDVAVVEVGLGGRLDATNVVIPLVSVITSLSYDHTHLLGETLPEIAAEKGGIIKPGVPVITAPQTDDALAVLSTIAQERGAPLSVVESRSLISQDWWYRVEESTIKGQRFMAGQVGQPGEVYNLSLLGTHQAINGTVALAALHHAKRDLPELNDEVIKQGVASVSWPGRFQILQERPTLIVDGAHNVDSVNRLCDTLEALFPGRRIILILGVTIGKAIEGMIEALTPVAAELILTAAEHPRAIPSRKLAEFVTTDTPFNLTESVADALALAFEMAGHDDIICATGSLFVVGDLLTDWKRRQENPHGLYE